MAGRIDQSVKLIPGKHDEIIDALKAAPNKQEWLITALTWYVNYTKGNPPPPSNDATPPAPFNPSEFAEAVRDGLAEGIKGLGPVLASAMLPYRPSGNFAENSIAPPNLDDLPSLIVASPEPVDVNAQRDAFARGMGDLFADDDDE